MAVYTSINYGQPVDSILVNGHTSEVIAPGIYKGMWIRSHGSESRAVDVRNVEQGDDDLDTDRIDLYGLAFMPQGMRVVITAPQLYSETDDILSRLVIEEAGSTDRVDLVCLEYAYKPVIFKHNKPKYTVIKGVEAEVGKEPVFPEVFLPSETSGTGARPADYWKKVRIPMAYVRVRAGKQYIDDSDIQNIRRTLNTNGVMDYIADLIYSLMGNCRYEGWHLVHDSGEAHIKVTPGYGLINGKVLHTYEERLVHDIRPQVVLMNEQQPGPNMSLDNQPAYPTQLKIRITAGEVDIPAESSFTIAAHWVSGTSEVEQIRELVIHEAIPAGEHLDVITDYIISVNEGGLNFSGIIGSDASDKLVSIKNLPIAYVVAVADDSKEPHFYAEYDPRHIAYLPPNEMWLGYVKVDEDIYYLYDNSDIDNARFRFTLATPPDLNPMFARPR